MAALGKTMNVAQGINAGRSTIAGGDTMMRVGGPAAGQRLEVPQDEPAPGEWWKTVPPERRDWWTNRLNRMPYANTERFQDGIVVDPRPGWWSQNSEYDRETDILDKWQKARRERDRATRRRPR